MKKCFLIFFTLFLVGFSSKAQPYQGMLEIINQTECEMLWDVVAICPGPPCAEYSTATMNNISANTTTGYISFNDYPWIGDVQPPCEDWTWAYATVVLHGSEVNCDLGEPAPSGGTIKVGLPNVRDCSGNLYGTYSYSDVCTCNGDTVNVSFTVINPGNVATLRIY